MEEICGDNFIKVAESQGSPQIKNTSTVGAFNVREFFLLFYGGSWSQKSRHLIPNLQELLKQLKEEDDKTLEVLYISNDEDEEQFLKFYLHGELGQFSYAIPFNDARIPKIRELFGLDAVPMVVVLDKNLELVTLDGAADIIMLPPQMVRNVWIQTLKARK